MGQKGLYFAIDVLARVLQVFALALAGGLVNWCVPSDSHLLAANHTPHQIYFILLN